MALHTWLQRLLGRSTDQPPVTEEVLPTAVPPQDLPAIGQPEPRCPTCDHPFTKMPGRKTKCRHCGQFCYVRTRPRDRQRVLVTEAQIALIEEQWAMVNGTHEAFLAQQRAANATRAALAERFGREPSMHEVQ